MKNKSESLLVIAGKRKNQQTRFEIPTYVTINNDKMYSNFEAIALTETSTY